MVILPKPRAVIFDWDNTLVNTWPTIHEALNKTFTEMGKEPWDIHTVKQRVARSMRDSFPDIFGPDWKAAGEVYQSHFRAIHLEKLDSLPGAEDMLKWLHDRSLYLAVASNKRGVNLRKEVEHIGWKKYFSHVIGADDTPKDKPAAEPVLAALSGSGITPGKEVWFIGDSAVDMECAYVTDCTAVFYGELPVEPLKFQPKAYVANHNKLVDLFEAVLK